MKSKTVIFIDTIGESTEHFDDHLSAAGVTQVERMNPKKLLERDQLPGSDLIILNCLNLSEGLIGGLLLFADRNRHAQILVLTHNISIYAYRQVAVMKNIVILQAPFVSSVFESLVRELTTKAGTDQWRGSRFITNEPARMLVMESGLLIATRMRNYSAGGAFLEYKGISLKVGHNLHLSLLNPETIDVKDRLKMSARVKWLRDGDGPNSQARGVGVQFVEISPDSIF